MKLHEYHAKSILARYGIPVPQGEVADNPQQAFEISRRLGGRSVIKAQVHAGGRGKAGGIVLAESPEDAKRAAESLLGKTLVTFQTGPEGVAVGQVLVEQTVDVARELYLGLTVDRTYRGPVMIASEAGGIDIEEVAASTPEKILREPVDPFLGFQAFQGRRIAAAVHLESELVKPASQIMSSVAKLFMENDCSLVEINPLVVTQSGELIALDAKLSLDDDALFRHQELQEMRDLNQEDALEAEAVSQGISYVKLSGEVGCLVNGAGLAMATMDVIKAAGLEPANFLDVGGGASEEKVAAACRIMLADPKVERVLVNVFGGIARCDVVARGLVKAVSETNPHIRLYVRLLGTNRDEAVEILNEANLNVQFADTLAQVAVLLASG